MVVATPKNGSSTLASTGPAREQGLEPAMVSNSSYSWRVLDDSVPDGYCEVPACLVFLLVECVGKGSDVEAVVVLAL